MLSAFGNAFKTPDLRKKILFTLFILAVFRLGSTIPSPNVNLENIHACQVEAAAGDAAGLYSMINLFSGGALLQLAIFALGIMPYITASIILQLLTVVIPRLEKLKKEGGAGQTKITQYTRYLTIVLAVMQSTAFTTLAVNGQLFQGCSRPVVYDSSIFPIIVMVLTMTAGTGIIMWMGELITDRGIGNGMSVMIFTQIAAQFPTQMWSIALGKGTDPNNPNMPNAAGWLAFAMVLALGLLVMLGVIFMEQAQRRIPVQYAKRMVGRRLVGGTTTYIPLKVNQAGVIPIIFASSMLYLPMLYAQFQTGNPVSSWIAQHLSGSGSPWYNAVYFVLIIAFTYFYVSITFDPVEVADNMKKYGGFVPGIRAGRPTEKYLAYVLSRLTAPGSLYLALISLLPALAWFLLGEVASRKFPFGGTSILIIVGVGLDTVKQIESQLQQRNYEGFLR
ncbi:preprotein translocase subunit SecY [Propioniciclava tarda]|uniref:Protein translocase subunit SecY n=1 Tax=Propioniciclava tarda TaxID=433330 RepID=A0A4Q9KI16_PROTD|nr:preprotein translocase subunit SecY [Propioniciclava tarda]TBT93005.1 preprotein translocase subunit SecY [Propioniciclava tarda]SMO81478.1 protein translocase subunit secY/sec61 alpha [Propioniciclava tarda]HOA88617.1 preprotein translocase subunit SecY [Propioniciclava tarda]HQA30783.1 preprotein translocase subunit SecY [Propioniciclava tarda]HQD61291.1 preprotein translocase subunit SecY [Propioniciclava tarda]